MSPNQKRHRRCFQYKPLQPNSFRLLELLPGQSLRADIHCRLREYEFDSAPPYEALSYTWGDDESICRISLDSLSFHIRPNVRDVLRRLRQRGTRLIWIDAICIDQINTNEKSIQVPLMRKIYTKAERVIVWLGEETSDSGMALNFIPDLTRVAELDTESDWLSHAQNDRFLVKMASLVRLFSHSWWTRTWIIQEVVLAPDVLVLCGSRHVPWSTFHSLTKKWIFIKHVPHRLFNMRQKATFRCLGALVGTFLDPLTELRQLRQIVPSAQNSLKLQSLLWSFKNQSVTDPRDKIYGLLGLVDNHRDQVDYAKSPEDTYLAFFSSCLLEDKGLDWFCWMTGEEYDPTKLCLPSWVPDFGQRFLKPISFPLQPIFSTTGPKSLFAIQFEDDNRTLILRGRLFDVASQCGPIYPSSDDYHLGGYATKPILFHWKEMAMQSQSEIFHSHIAKEDAFWRAILTDRDVEGFHFDDSGRYSAKRLPAGIQHIPPKSAKDEEELFRTMNNQKRCLNGRRFGITRKGHFCLLPPTTAEGDLICVLLGGEVPYVLRRIDDQSQDYYTMVGECYVHGIMDGEAIPDILEGKDEGDIFRLR